MTISTAEVQARAGLVASESSLLGLGSGALIGTTLAASLLGHAAAPIVRPGLAAGAALCTCGVLLAWLGHALDLGGTSRKHEGLARLWWPIIGLGALLALAGWTTLAFLVRHDAAAGADPVWPWGPQVAAGTLLSLLLALMTLSAVALRALVAIEPGAPMPVAHLFQSAGHALLGGLGLLMVIGYASDAMGVELKYALGTAICTVAAHTILWSAWLLQGARRAIVRLHRDGVRMPMLERGHAMASAVVVLGLLAPALTVLAGLVTGRDVGLTVACAVLAVSNHAMRYAWVLMPMRHPPVRSGQVPATA